MFSHLPDDEAGRQAAAWRSLRSRAIALGLLSGLALRPIGALWQVVAVPPLLSHLGARSFGLLEGALSVSAWMGLGNLGMNLSAMNRLTDARIGGDSRSSSRALALYLAASLESAGLVFVIWCIVCSGLALGGVGRMRILPLWSAGVGALLSLAAGPASAIYGSRQEAFKDNVWDFASKLATLGVCIFALRCATSVAVLAFLITATTGFVRLLNLVLLVRQHFPGASRYLRNLPPFREQLSMLREGLYFFALQIAVLLIYHSDRSLLLFAADPTILARYALIARPLALSYGFFMVLQGPLWHAYGDALRRHDLLWARHLLDVTRTLAPTGFIVLAGLTYAYGGRAVAAWTGQAEIIPPPFVGAGIALGLACRAWIDAHSPILNTSGVVRPQLAALSLQAVLTLGCTVVAIVVLRRPYLVSYAVPLAAIASSVWLYPPIVRALLNRQLPTG